MRTASFVGLLLSAAGIVLSCAGLPPETPSPPPGADCKVPLAAECPIGRGLFGRFDKLPSAGPPLTPEVEGDDSVAFVDSAAEPCPECPPVASGSAEQTMLARMLYNAERYSEAVPELRAVADGRTGKDEDNRQVAEYSLMVALYRLDELTAAEDLILAILGSPDHTRFSEV